MLRGPVLVQRLRPRPQMPGERPKRPHASPSPGKTSRCHELPRATAPSSRRSRELPRSPPQPVWCVQRPRTPGPCAHTSPSPSRNLISTEPRQVHKQRHPGTKSSKSFKIFSTSGGSRRRGVTNEKLNTALQQPNLSMWDVTPRGTRPGGKSSV